MTTLSTMSHRNALGGRRSSLTDLDAEAQAKLIADYEASQQQHDMLEVKMPSFGIEDIDHKANLPTVNIGLKRLRLSDHSSSAVKFQASLKRAS